MVIYQIAKNCRTSVEMIENFYAAHIKTTLDASAINVKKGNPGRTEKPQKIVDFKVCCFVLARTISVG